MIQDKYISDAINYHRYGLEYALKRIREDCTCRKCKPNTKTAWMQRNAVTEE